MMCRALLLPAASRVIVPKEHLKIARRFNACHYPQLFGLVLVFLISNLIWL
jgi:hypothetical protein